ncbi:MAG: lipid-A-disaccharide synthase [Proteobacteria bacterium]|nr:lipid-A-disaccharide synthase [Pseudomonadota bacterium]
MTRVLVAAGDVSGDQHAAELVAALTVRRPDLECFGLGGPELQKAGMELVVHQRDLAVGGLWELWGRLPRLARAYRQLSAVLRERAPDLVVLVDSGGFNLPFARRVGRACRAPILYYVAPQVWAWRRGRIRKLAKRVDRLAVIFPFEPQHYAGTGVRVEFVGHPLVDRLRAERARLDADRCRRDFGIAPGTRSVVLLPGSRENELRYQLPVQLEVARRLHRGHASTRFLLALSPGLALSEAHAAIGRAGLPADLAIEVVEGRSFEAMCAADVAVAKPGTVTVELGLLGCPMVVVGKAHPLTAAVVRRAVRVPSFSMPNLILGRDLVPEFLQEAAVPDAIAAEVEPLFAGPARDRQLAGLSEMARRLGGGGAALRTAELAEELLGAAAA